MSDTFPGLNHLPDSRTIRKIIPATRHLDRPAYAVVMDPPTANPGPLGLSRGMFLVPDTEEGRRVVEACESRRFDAWAVLLKFHAVAAVLAAILAVLGGRWGLALGCVAAAAVFAIFPWKVSCRRRAVVALADRSPGMLGPRAFRPEDFGVDSRSGEELVPQEMLQDRPVSEYLADALHAGVLHQANKLLEEARLERRLKEDAERRARAVQQEEEQKAKAESLLSGD